MSLGQTQVSAMRLVIVTAKEMQAVRGVTSVNQRSSIFPAAIQMSVNVIS